MNGLAINSDNDEANAPLRWAAVSHHVLFHPEKKTRTGAKVYKGSIVK